MALKTKPFEPEKYLTTRAAQREFLVDAFETGDAGHIADAIGVVARARGITQVAAETGLSRVGLYKGLSKDGDPRLSTVLNVLRSAGFELAVKGSR